MAKISFDYLDDLMVRSAHHSTAIEGNTLTLGDSKTILIDGYAPGHGTLKEVFEVYNYKFLNAAMIQCLADKAPVSQKIIKEFHSCICRNIPGIEGGQYKRTQNMVVGAAFTPVEPFLVPEALEEWCNNCNFRLNHAQSESEIIDILTDQHIRFELIHPFPDGNGRTGRALMVYQCLLNKIVPFVIQVEDRARYIGLMNNFDAKGLSAYCRELSVKEKERAACFVSRDGDGLELNLGN